MSEKPIIPPNGIAAPRVNRTAEDALKAQSDLEIAEGKIDALMTDLAAARAMVSTAMEQRNKLREERNRLRRCIARIDAINDDPSRFNQEIDQVVQRALQRSAEPGGPMSVLAWDRPACGGKVEAPAAPLPLYGEPPLAQKPSQRERSIGYYGALIHCQKCGKWHPDDAPCEV